MYIKKKNSHLKLKLKKIERNNIKTNIKLKRRESIFKFRYNFHLSSVKAKNSIENFLRLKNIFVIQICMYVCIYACGYG